MTNLTYSDPERDVRIDAAHRGDIRCRKLIVGDTGSVVGNIEALDVRNFGRIQGIVNATDVFINSERAVLRGSVFAPHIGIHPNSTFEGSSSNRFPFRTDTSPPLSTPSAIERAIQQGVKRELERAGLAADDQGFAVSPNTTFRSPDGKQLPLSGNGESPQFVWAPPVPTSKVFRDGQEFTVVSEPSIASHEASPSDEESEALYSQPPGTAAEVSNSVPAAEPAPDPIETSGPDPIVLSGVTAPTATPSPSQRRPLPPLFASAN